MFKKRKQDLINKGNAQEIIKCKTHMYQTWENVLLKNVWNTKFNQNASLGSYVITAVRDNGTVWTHSTSVTSFLIGSKDTVHYGAARHIQL